MFKKIIKRDGRSVTFKDNKIFEAIEKAGVATGEFGQAEANKLAQKAIENINQLTTKKISVEAVQDIVENVLISSKYKKNGFL